MPWIPSAYRRWPSITRLTGHPAPIKALLQPALTGKINDRETFMKGIDYSYYYEEES